MSNNARNARGVGFWISAWLPVALGVAVIAVTSSAAFGADHTSGPLRWVWQALFGPVSNARWGHIHLYIRKSGHFIGYGLIGVAWLRAWWMTLPRSRFLPDALLALLGTALLSSCDEWHQKYLPNRVGSPWDVMLDCCGVLAMCLAVYVFACLFQPRWLERAP